MIQVQIEEWTPEHPRWGEVEAAIAQLGQRNWVSFVADWHRSSHLLVALADDEVAGFLRYVCQPIGPDADCPALMWKETELLEAKILAFGVLPSRRRQGLGRALQLACIEQARAQQCHQVRSHSSGESGENHRLKLALGFAAQPVVRGNDRSGVYFVLPLGNQLK